MIALYPSQLAYVNRVNTILLTRHGTTFQAAGFTVQQVLKHQEQGFSEDQFVAYVQQQREGVPA